MLCNDNMVKNIYFQNLSRFRYVFCQFYIGSAGLVIARWVVVTENDRKGFLIKGFLENHLRISYRSAHSANADLFFSDNDVGSVEENRPKFLMQKVANDGLHEINCFSAATDFFRVRLLQFFPSFT